MASTKTFYLTTPIYYVNDLPHIGHAYTTVAADTLGRFHRLLGKEVFLLTGTDEHGQKVERAAREQGLEPKDLADQVVDRFRSLWDRLHIQPSDFIRTTEGRHLRAVEALFLRVRQKGDIYLADYEGWYCTQDESFWTETQVQGGRCPECGRPVERLKEKSYFFRMSRYQEALLRHLKAHPTFIRPEGRRNEILRFVEGGLRDLSISRTSFRWGIPVPGDPGHVIYVWFDALANYISALGFGEEEGPRWGFWPADLHLVGKDILRFHAVYWPTFLMAADLPLPRQIFAHGWWTVQGKKMSKSLQNVVDPNLLIDRYGADALRYFLLREVPFGADGDFSHQALIGRLNSDLANDLGNLLQRTLVMLGKYGGGRVPEAREAGPEEASLRAAARRAVERVEASMAEVDFQEALKDIWEFINLTNKYLDSRAPWALAKAGEERAVQSVLFHAAEALRVASVLLWPFIPHSAENLRSQLGLPREPSSLEEARNWGLLPVGAQTRPGPSLFPRIEVGVAEEVRVREKVRVEIPEREEGTSSPGGGPPGEVDLDVFQQLDLRTARVVAAERVKRSKHLLKLEVDLGSERRTVVAGIAKSYAPEELVGKTLILVANLKPRTLMGIESRGMVLAVEQGEGFVLIGPESPVEPGRPVS